MSKTFKIIISTISLFATAWFIFAGIPFLSYPSLTLQVITSALFPFFVLLMAFVVYTYFRVISDDNGFDFYFLNTFGAVSFLTFLYSIIPFIVS